MKNLLNSCSLLILIFSASCRSGNDRFITDIKLPVIEQVKILRYEQALFSINRSHLKEELLRIQPNFRMFLDGDLNDTLNLSRIANFLDDTLLQHTFSDCRKAFDDITWLETELTQAFAHYHYYYPDRALPDVYTYISGFDYENPVMLLENHLLIAVDMYLGDTYLRYKNLGLPGYIIHRFNPEYVVSDCVKELATTENDPRQSGTYLLDLMLAEGKQMWFCKAMIPEIHDSILLDYSAENLQWLEKHEPEVWAFMIENKMLYSQDLQNIKKLIGEAPFTSYFGNDSPPRLGRYIGWKIIESYMNRNPEVSLQELLRSFNAQEILNQSGYKP
ncbi:MAG: hypothetical protein FJY07_02875 [Bacteroidetes bacterium]|nr:hypothetical protein [Bacteroidota bacterium]